MSKISLKRLDEIIVSNLLKSVDISLLLIIAITLILTFVQIKVVPLWFKWIALIFSLAFIYITGTRLNFMLFQLKIGKWMLHRYILPPGCCGIGFWKSGQVVDYHEQEEYKGSRRIFEYFTLDGMNYPVTSIQKIIGNVDAILSDFRNLWLLPLLRKKMKKS